MQLNKQGMCQGGRAEGTSSNDTVDGTPLGNLVLPWSLKRHSLPLGKGYFIRPHTDPNETPLKMTFPPTSWTPGVAITESVFSAPDTRRSVVGGEGGDFDHTESFPPYVIDWRSC